MVADGSSRVRETKRLEYNGVRVRPFIWVQKILPSPVFSALTLAASAALDAALRAALLRMSSALRAVSEPTRPLSAAEGEIDDVELVVAASTLLLPLAPRFKGADTSSVRKVPPVSCAYCRRSGSKI